MIHDEAVAVIDFQDALLAPPQYDLASLLNDRTTDSVIQPDLEEKLVDYYIDRRVDMEKQTINRDEFTEMYLLSAIQRDLKVVGRFITSTSSRARPPTKIYSADSTSIET